MVLDVAAAVILRRDGAFLLARRPAKKVYEGYWEFPGGKVDAGEAPAGALVRELHEELGIDAECVLPWITRTFAYPHGVVRLRFFRVTRWRGTPEGREGQALHWQHAAAPRVAPMLPANAPVLDALALPDEYAITNAAVLGVEAQLDALRRRFDQGLRLVQVREPLLPAAVRESFTHRVVSLARPFRARVLVSSDTALARQAGAQGVHLPSRVLQQCRRRPDMALVAASCHTAEDIACATRLGADFAVLGPVMPTASHPGAQTLGWDGFSRRVAGAAMPVYAIGGMCADDVPAAGQAGGHGVAMIRGSWR